MFRISRENFTGPAVCAASFPLVLQFLVVPFFGDINQVGKGLLALYFILALGIFRLRTKKTFRISAPACWFLLPTLALFFSALGAVSPFEALISLGYLLALILFCFCVVDIAPDDHRFGNRWVSGLLLTGVVGSVLGLYEYVRYALLGKSSRMVIPWLLPPDANSRVDGIYGQPNLFALLLTLVLLGFFYNFIHVETIKCRWGMGLSYLPVSLAALVLFLTGSRAGLLSFAIVFLLLGWLLARGRYLAGDRAGRLEFLRLCGFVGLGFLAGYLISKGYWRPSGVSLATDTAQKLATVTDHNTSTRLLFWGTAWTIFLDHPWLGIGLDNFKLIMAPYRMTAQNLFGMFGFDAFGYSKWAHNELLQLLAEGGLLTVLPLLVLLGAFLRAFSRKVFSAQQESGPFFLYSHLFLLPFLIQGMLSWPLRHASLLVLFFLLVGSLLAQYRTREIRLTRFSRTGLSGLLTAGLVCCCLLSWQEYRLGWFFRNFRDGPSPIEQMAALQAVCTSPFVALRALTQAIPHYTESAVKNRDDDRFARGLIPMAERLTRLQEHETHWVNLGLLYLRVGALGKAAEATQKALDLRPDYALAWELKHYLNMLAAAEATGQPVENFYPHPPGGRYHVPELFYVGNQPAERKQDL